jgi:hypothetical protein
MTKLKLSTLPIPALKGPRRGVFRNEIVQLCHSASQGLDPFF